MKKTLVTLFALAGAAFATELSTDGMVYLTPSTTSVTLSGESGSAYATILLNETALTMLSDGSNINSNFFAFTTQDGGTAEHVGIGGGTFGGARIILDGREAGSFSGGITRYTVLDNSAMKALFSSAVQAVITLGITGSGTTDEVIFSTMDAAGTISSVTWTNSGVNHADVTYSGAVTAAAIDARYVTEAYAAQGAWTSASLQALSESMLAPEPATASLSLLALAGLMARRKRH